MKSNQSNQSIIFIRTDRETKERFAKNAKLVFSDQNTIAEMLIKKWNQKICRYQHPNN